MYKHKMKITPWFVYRYMTLFGILYIVYALCACTFVPLQLAKTIILQNFSVSNTVKNIVQNNLSSGGEYLIDTCVCKVPDVEPFDSTIEHLIKTKPRIRICDDHDALTYVLKGVLHVNNTSGKIAYCDYRPIFGLKNTFKFGPRSKPFSKSIQITDEYLKVECYNYYGKIVSENVHFNFIKRKPNDMRGQTGFSDYIKTLTNRNANVGVNQKPPRLNVLLLLFDATSRLNSFRYLTKTRQFLVKTLGAIEMRGYNKVGESTIMNMIPLLTGHFHHDLTCLQKADGVDECPFIWKDYSKQNYITHFAEDWAKTGMFNYYFPGFQYKPTDYYDHPFHLVNEENWTLKSGVCKLSSKRLYERMFDLAYNLKDDYYFSFSSHANFTHDDIEGLSSLDILTVRTLSKMYENNLLNNTFLAIFGDHGMRYGKFRQTLIGQLEDRRPMMIIYLPQWFRSTYQTYMNNLKANAGKLTTHFDMYQTLLHLLNLDNSSFMGSPGKGISLLNEIPRERTCKEASIFPHLCTCNFHQASVVNSTTQFELGNVLTIHLNNILNKYKHLCEKLTLASVLYCVKLYSAGLYTDDFRIVIKTSPGGGIIEATLRHDKTFRNYFVTGNFSRINAYRGQADCMNDIILQVICICKK